MFSLDHLAASIVINVRALHCHSSSSSYLPLICLWRGTSNGFMSCHAQTYIMSPAAVCWFPFHHVIYGRVVFCKSQNFSDPVSCHVNNTVTCVRNNFQPCRVMKAVSRCTTGRAKFQVLQHVLPSLFFLGMSRRARAWQLRSWVRDVVSDAKYQRHGRMLMRSGETIRRHRGVTTF